MLSLNTGSHHQVQNIGLDKGFTSSQKDLRLALTSHLWTRPHVFEMRGTPGMRHGDADRGFQNGLYTTALIGGMAGSGDTSLLMAVLNIFWRSLTRPIASFGSRSPWAKQMAPLHDFRSEYPSKAASDALESRRTATIWSLRIGDNDLALFASATAVSTIVGSSRLEPCRSVL